MILFEELRFLLVLLIVCGVGPALCWCWLGCLGLPREAEDFRRRGRSPSAAQHIGPYGRGGAA